ncbi:hypothetical protein C8J57DRAFT_1219924 [Mycena rebaudengoi]|nr:hypothetical protein C8J57DRAFT_1219924 [Mycena rebaudengoi]
MTPKIWASIEAIRAISHQFAQRQTAIRWLECGTKTRYWWLLGSRLSRRGLTGLSPPVWVHTLMLFVGSQLTIPEAKRRGCSKRNTVTDQIFPIVTLAAYVTME